jgi:hypothetical protein
MGDKTPGAGKTAVDLLSKVEVVKALNAAQWGSIALLITSDQPAAQEPHRRRGPALQRC